MQAAQSNTASDRTKPFPGPAPLEPDAHPGAGREAPASSHLFSASPILSPISAARRYLERQRGDSQERQRGDSQERQRESQERQRGSQERQRGAGRPGSASGEGEAGLPGRESPSRDRRLERSLYEALAEEDATESPAAYPISYPDARPITRSMEGGGEAALDPERVRGAISRLARSAEESRPEAGWAAARARLTPQPVGLRPEQAPAKAVHEAAVPKTAVPGGAWPQTAETETGVKTTDIMDITDMKTAETPPMAFAEVARRLWGAGIAISEADTVSPAQPPAGRTPAMRTEDVREVVEIEGSPEDLQAAEFRGLLQAVAERPVPSDPAAVPGIGAAEAGNAKAAEAKDAKAAGSLVENAPALAHDACNLLSALGLYGELLAFPGVLGQEHRHYAEELKLLAARSEVLIGRLLRTAEPEEQAAAGCAAAAQDVKKAGYQAEESRVEAPVQPPFAAQAASPEAMGPGALAADTAAPQPASLRPAAAPASAAGDPQATNLVDLLMRWGSLLSTLAHGTLEVSFGPGAATPVPAAAEPLERILVNLVRNARAATAGGGAIRIGVGRRETAPEAVVLTVDDSGCGMDEAQVRSILAGETAASPRLEGERDGAGVPVVPAAGGRRRRGLGLQIVRELAAASGGALSIQSRPGTGTRIEIRWPVAQAAAAPRAAAGDQPETEAAAAAAAGDAAERDGPAGAGAGGIPRPVSILPEGASGIEGASRTEGAFRTEGACQTEGAFRGERAVPPGSGPGSGPGSASGVRETGAGPVRMPEPVGPDGFSEEQLRAMMLRLHRSAPGERIRAGAPWTSQVPSQGTLPGPSQGLVAGSVWGSARGGGLSPGRPVPAGGAAAMGVLRDGPGAEGAGADRDSGDDSALKGAIAC